MERIGFYLMVLIILPTLSACGTTPTTQIETFAESSFQLTEEVDELIKEYNQHTVQTELFVTAASHLAGNNAISNFDRSSLNRIQPVIGNDFFKKTSIYRANKALQSYAKALRDLAQSGSRKDITTAAVGLTGSLTEMNASYATLKGQDDVVLVSADTIGTIGAVIDAIGSTIAEEKRRAAIKSIVIKADPLIRELVAVVVQTIDDVDFIEDMETDKNTRLNNMIADYKKQVNSGSFKNFAEKKEALESLWVENQKAITVSKRIKHLQKSLEEIAKQHGKVKEEVEKNRFTSAAILAAAGKLKDMKDRYEELDELITSCEKIEIKDDGVPTCKDGGDE